MGDCSNFNFLNSYCDTLNPNVLAKEIDDKLDTSINSSFSVPSDTSISVSWPKGEKIHDGVNIFNSASFEIEKFHQSDTFRENPSDKNKIIQRWAQNVLNDIMSSVDLAEIKKACSFSDNSASLSQILSEEKEDESTLHFKEFDEKIYQDALFFGKIVNMTKNVNNLTKIPISSEKNPCKRVMSFMDIDEDLIAFQQTKLSQSQIGLSPFVTNLPVRFDTASNNIPVSFILGEPVVFVGTNPTKQNILIKKQIQVEKIYLEPFSGIDLLTFIASGPFQRYDKNVDDDSLISKIARAIIEKKPNLVLINGPLIDSNHPRILDYTCGTFSDLFIRFRNILIKAALEVEAKIIFISSYKEFGQRPMYPTVPCTLTKGISKEVLNSRVYFGPDPCFINFKSQQTLDKGPSLVISSTDVVMHLSGEETSIGLDNSKPEMDRITRISGSIYPMNPSNFDVPMNYTMWSENCNFKPVEDSKHHERRYSPHCFIMPSFLNFSTKVVNGVLFVNPGLASRLYGDGSYSLVQMKSSTEKLTSLKKHLIMNSFKL